MPTRIPFIGLAFGLVLLATTIATACPLCGSPQKTISEDFAAADVVVLAQWSDGKSPAGMLVGSTTFSVVEVARGESKSLKEDATLSVPKFHAGQRGDLFLLFGQREDDELVWRPLEITEAGYQYVKQAPAADVPIAKRLEYFVRFLEFSDERIAMDAYWEFANAPWEDIVKTKHKLDRAKLNQWLQNEKTLPNRLNLYFLLLGLCGNDADARMLENLVRVPPPGLSLGRDGLMSSYLLLAGDKGLKVLDETKLTNPQAAFSEVYAAMQAVRFMWTYGNGRISPDRLRHSMRMLIESPDLAELAIADLARWEDWSVQDRVMRLYWDVEYNYPSIKRAFVRYLFAAGRITTSISSDPTKLTAELPNAEQPPHVLQARAHLKKLGEQDLKTVQQVERFFLAK